MSKLLDKLKSKSTIKQSSILSDSKFFNNKDCTSTELPIINAACSGDIMGGYRSGILTIAGPSRHFKSILGLFAVKAYLKKNPEAVCLYYDSEFGSPPEYLEAMGIDASRVLHSPILHVEQLKFDISAQLENIERGEKIIVFIDSIGNLASKKEVDDANDQKSVADMTRAKQIKSLFRIATPHFVTKDIPCIVINHTYESQGMYSSQVVSGGTGVMYSSDAVWVIGRAQEKEGTDLAGYKFTINIEKSRYVREKSKFPFIVKFTGGIDKWSGLLDIALELGHVIKPKNGWYTRIIPNKETGELLEDRNWRAKDTSCAEFWGPVIKDTDFVEKVKSRYALGGIEMIHEEEQEDGPKLLLEEEAEES